MLCVLNANGDGKKDSGFIINDHGGGRKGGERFSIIRRYRLKDKCLFM